MLSAAIAEDTIRYRYRYGGLKLESSEPLAQLREECEESGEAKASLSLDVMEGPLPTPDTILFRWNGRTGWSDDADDISAFQPGWFNTIHPAKNQCP